MRNFFLPLCFAFLAHSAVAEVVQISDGRSVDLKPDGTYEVVGVSVARQDDYVLLSDPYFTLHKGKYGSNSVRFMPIFSNVGSEDIVGVKFTARFLNPFGEEQFVFSGSSDEAVTVGSASTYDLFYVFEDNQFIPDEAYDRLLPLATNQTGSVDVVIEMIALKSGSVINLSE